MPTEKETAHFLRLGLRLGLIDTKTVERWVDSIIVTEPVIRFPFTELAGASNLSPNKVDELLGQVMGAGDVYVPGRIILALVRRLLRGDKITPEAALKVALQAGRAGELAESEYNKADGLDESIWLATHETYGTLEEIRRDIAEFFEKYAEFDELIPTVA